MTGSLSLCDHPGDLVRLTCEKCRRSGRYRNENLIVQFGPDIPLPDLRLEIAKYEREGKMHDMCGVPYEGLTGVAEW